MNKVISVLLVISVISISGCLEERDEFTLNPDGSGKVVHEVTFKPMSISIMGNSATDPNKQLKQSIKRILEKSEGVDTWENVSYELTSEGEIYFRGTAFFPDINSLNLDRGGSTNKYRYHLTKKQRGEISLELKGEDEVLKNKDGDKSTNLSGAELANRINKAKLEYDQSKLMMQSLLSKMKIERTFHLPGEITKTSNFKKVDDKTIEIVIKGSKVLEMMDDVMADEILLKEQIRAGKDPIDGLEEMEMNEKLFGQKEPVQVVFKDTVPLFEYKSEMATAKKNYEIMLKKLKLDEISLKKPNNVYPLNKGNSISAIGVPDYSKPVITQLREGSKKQREKDFDGAIKIYQNVIANTKAAPRDIARAYYHLGETYLEKGDDAKAAEQFEYLTQNFPEQKSSVLKAKRELKKMGIVNIENNIQPSNGAIPEIINTTPALLTNDVSPNLREISFTFNRPMKDGYWSWTQFDKNTYPEMLGQPFFDTKKITCTHRVKLKPGTIYMIGINQAHKSLRNLKNIGLSTGFMSTTGKKAKPYILLFATKSSDGNQTVIPEDIISKAREINTGVANPEILAKKTSTKRVQNISGTELNHINVKEIENLKYSTGPEIAVKFKSPSQDTYLKGIWVYGFRSKHAKKEDFISHILLCTKDLTVFEDYPFATSEFSDKHRHWVGLQFSPKRKLPSEFIIRMNSSERTVSVGFNPRKKGNSFILTPDGEMGLWSGEWMIVPVVEKTLNQ